MERVLDTGQYETMIMITFISELFTSVSSRKLHCFDIKLIDLHIWDQ